MTLRGLPRTIGTGMAWIAAAAAFASWAGWLEAPNSAAERARIQQQQAEQRASESERAIVILQYQNQMTAAELNRMNGKLDEMAMVLYSMERRSR